MCADEVCSVHSCDCDPVHATRRAGSAPALASMHWPVAAFFSVLAAPPLLPLNVHCWYGLPALHGWM